MHPRKTLLLLKQKNKVHDYPDRQPYSLGIDRPIEKGTAHSAENVLKNAMLLVETFRSKGLPFIAVNVNPLGAAWTKTRTEVIAIPPDVVTQTLTKGEMRLTGYTELIAELDIHPEDIHITKRGWNAFFQTPLHDELQKREITQIVLCGISTSIGVEGTARAASELGYNIIFATDAMTDTVFVSHNNSLLNLFPQLRELNSAYDVINLLNLRDLTLFLSHFTTLNRAKRSNSCLSPAFLK